MVPFSRIAGVNHPGVLLTGFLAVFCQGCGETDRTTPASAATSHAEVRPPITAAAAQVPGSSTAAERSTNSRTDDPRSRTKWLGDIPYDVFYDDPLVIAADDRLVNRPDRSDPSLPSGARAIEPLRDASSPTPRRAERTVEPSTNSASSSVDWQRLAKIDVLSDEVKQLRNRMTANLRTVATYNRGIDAVANDAVVLAAIACVVAEHTGSLSWRSHAPAVRDLAAELAGHALLSGREAYSAAQTSFEQLLAILDGGLPPDGNAAEDVPFCDVAERSEMMKRIKRSFDWLKSEINSESHFRDAHDQTAREATLLAVLGGLVSTESYDYAGEPEYQLFVRNFIEGNVGMTAAVRADDYQSFITSRDRVQHACAQCHAAYALGDEGL